MKFELNTDFWENRKVLVTGCNGYLGVELCSILSAAGSNVVAVDMSKEGHTLFKESENIQYCCLELTSTEGVKELLEKHCFETCFHLAANSDVARMDREPEVAFQTNVEMAWILFDSFRKYLPGCNIVFPSSNHVYGKQSSYPSSETSEFNPENIYGITKGVADQIALGYARVYKLPITVARITNTFGGRSSTLKHLIPQVVMTLLKDGTPIIKSDGQSRKGFLYIEDTMNALILLAEKMKDKSIWGEAFNFFPDRNMSVLEIVQAIISVLDKKHVQPIVEGEVRHGNEVDVEYLCNLKAKEKLSWNIKYSFQEGVKKAIEDYKYLLGKL